MEERTMTEKEARKAIIAWAKQEFTPISTDPEEYAALSPRVDVVSIARHSEHDDHWQAVLSIAGGRLTPRITFWQSAEPGFGLQVHVE